MANNSAMRQEELAGLGAQVEEIELTLDDPITIMQPLWSIASALGVAQGVIDAIQSINAVKRCSQDPDR